MLNMSHVYQNTWFIACTGGSKQNAVYATTQGPITSITLILTFTDN